MTLERRPKPIEYVVLWNGVEVSRMTADALRNALTDAGQEIDALAAQVATKQGRIDSLQAKVDALQAKVDDLQAKLEPKA